MEYLVVRAQTIGDLNEKVNEILSKGYSLVGQVQVAPFNQVGVKFENDYLQTMVLEEDTDGKLNKAITAMESVYKIVEDYRDNVMNANDIVLDDFFNQIITILDTELSKIK